jgi:hypothetical protein
MSKTGTTVTLAMVEACAAEMVKRDWLPEQWDKDVPLCSCCEQPVPENHRSARRPEPDETRDEIFIFLTAAFDAQEPS